MDSMYAFTYIPQLFTVTSQFPMENKRRPSKEVPAGEALRPFTSFDYFICNIPVVICKLDLVFFFDHILNRQFKKSFALAGT